VNTVTELYLLIVGTLAVVGALAVVFAKSPLRAAMGLLLTVGSTAALYLGLHAPLLAVLQLLVYAGAIVVLFIFVIMMIGPAGVIEASTRALLARTAGLTIMAVITAALAFGLFQHQAEVPRVPGEFGWVKSFGRALYIDNLLPFELVSVTLLVAIVGAVAVARGRSAAEAEAVRKSRAEREEDRARRKEEEHRVGAEAAAHGGH
jgi:NADH-quinone oxidoreductase subunit J